MQPIDKRTGTLGVLSLFVFLTAMLHVLPGFLYDNNCWTRWATHIFTNGLGNAYESDTNYLPFYQYILWIYGKIMGSERAIAGHIYYLRCFTLLFDFAGLWLVWKWTAVKKDYLFVLAFGMMNIAYSYNTLIWGQTDSIAAVLAFAALYAAWRRNILVSGLLFVLAVNMKLQAIIFLPVWGLLILEWMMDDGQLRKKLLLPLSMVALQGLLVLPFALSTTGIAQIRHIVLHSSDRFPIVSVHAYNLWCWFITNTRQAPDNVPVFGLLTYKTIGLLLFIGTSFLALAPMIRKVIARIKDKSTPVNRITREEIWIASALIALLFFFCNTQMHERYAYPAFIFLTAYFFYTRKLFPYLLFSITYFLNIDGAMQWFSLPLYTTWIFDERFVACLYALLIIYLFIAQYRKTDQVLAA